MEASTMEYLSSKEKAQLEALRLSDTFVNETLSQLDSILTSETFRRVQDHAKDFIGLVVAMKALGREGEIKELTVATRAFGETSDFDPSLNRKIPMAAAQLREKLREYYAVEGRNATVEILISPGTYVPEFRDRRIVVAVGRFDNWNPGSDQDYLCGTVSDDIAHELSQMGAIEAVRMDKSDQDHGPRFGIRGSLECLSDIIRLNVSMSDISVGEILLSHTFRGHREELLKLSRQVASMAGSVLRADTEGRRTSNRRRMLPKSTASAQNGTHRTSASLNSDIA
jgi:TolB-like protein